MPNVEGAPDEALRRSRGRWWSSPWLLGVGLALLVAGPALRPGLLLNLDLVMTPDPPLPSGFWGLGPELPRQIPYFVPIAWLSTLSSGLVVGKLAMVAVIVIAFTGAHRLAAPASSVARAAAGLIYAAGPFLVTRLAIGHMGTALATAVLPWALPTLLRPADSLRRTLLWAAALGFCGVNGGILAAVVVLVGLAAERGRRIGPVLGVLMIGQLPWAVTGLVVSLQGVAPAGAEAFDTRLEGPLGLFRLVAGQGYFIGEFDVGVGRIVIPVVAAALLGLAALGHRDLPPEWRGRALTVAGFGLLVAAASGLPLIDSGYRAVADSWIGLPLREGHRVLGLFLVWLAPAAALGGQRVGQRVGVGGFLPLGLALGLVGPSLWGFGGQLVSVPEPDEWAQARQAVTAAPGPVLGLPWGQYLRPRLIDGRLVHNPLPTLLGGDVLIASGRGREGGPRERADPREEHARVLAAELRDGEPAEDELRALGIRWVALVETVDPTYLHLDEVPSLRSVVDGPSLRLYEVRDAEPSAVDADGRPVAVSSRVAPLASTVSHLPFTWFRPGAPGWLRGFEPTSITAEGNLAVPSARGPIWYWPSLLVLLADGVTLAAVLTAWRAGR